MGGGESASRQAGGDAKRGRQREREETERERHLEPPKYGAGAALASLCKAQPCSRPRSMSVPHIASASTDTCVVPDVGLVPDIAQYADTVPYRKLSWYQGIA